MEVSLFSTHSTIFAQLGLDGVVYAVYKYINRYFLTSIIHEKMSLFVTLTHLNYSIDHHENLQTCCPEHKEEIVGMRKLEIVGENK